jgi:hypothetical protein
MSENEMTGNLFFLASREAPTISQPVKAEALLVERICQGDQEAFGELYKMMILSRKFFFPLIKVCRSCAIETRLGRG